MSAEVKLPDEAATCALIKDGEVINMIVATPDFYIPGHVIIRDPPPHVTIGTKWEGGTFEEPPPEVEPK